jgi:hypothetical protein
VALKEAEEAAKRVAAEKAADKLGDATAEPAAEEGPGSMDIADMGETQAAPEIAPGQWFINVQILVAKLECVFLNTADALPLVVSAVLAVNTYLLIGMLYTNEKIY